MTTLNRIKSFLISKSFAFSDDGETEPVVGFKIIYDCEKNQLKVHVVGARNLPVCYGTQKPQGYFVKVKVFPGRQKYETEIKNESNPSFNQEFTFDLSDTIKDPFSGRFVVLTVYAVLTNNEPKSKLKSRTSFKNKINEIVGKKIESTETVQKRRNSNRMSLNNTRTVGAVTYNIEASVFKQILRDKSMATPDIWRNLQNISSGVYVESKESKKGSVEVTMSYSNSEDGKNDMIQVSLSKLRCSMQTMQDHEKLGGSLYLKMTVFEYDVKVATWKSDRFEPTISMKIDPKTATLQALVNNYNLDNIVILIRIMCKNMLAKKFQLGRIEIKKENHIWKTIIDAPTISVTNMLDFI